MRWMSLGLLCSIATTAVTQGVGKNSGAEREPPGQPPLIRSGYQDLPSNSVIIDYLRQWAGASDRAAYIQAGHSAGNRPIGGLVVSTDANLLNKIKNQALPETKERTGAAAEAERLRVLIVGGQHGNETASPEAVQQVIYQMLAGNLHAYPDTMDFILVPNANPDGRDLLRRENSSGVNTNTDYILLSQPESRALRKVLIDWQPHTVLDVHESTAYKEDSLAQQGYITVFEIQYEVGFEPNIDARLRSFGIDEFLPGLIGKAGAKNLQAARYIKEIYDVNQAVTHGGITLRNFRNYAGFHNSFSVLVEGRIDPPEGDYPSPFNIRNRTEELYHSVEAYLEQVRETSDRIKLLTNKARNDWRAQAGADQLALESEYGIEPGQAGIKIPLREIDTGEVIDREFKYHGRVVMIDSLAPPPAYAVTEHQDLIAGLLDRHGLTYQRIDRAVRLDGYRQTIEHLEKTPPPRGKGRYTLEFNTQSEPEPIELLPGDLWIDVSQPGGRLVPLLLELRSTTSIYKEQKYVDILEEGRFFVVPVKARSDNPLQARSATPGLTEN